LSVKPKFSREHHYSPTEARLLDLIPDNGKTVTIRELIERFYKDQPVPHSAEVYIRASMNRLIVKVRANREKFKIKHDGRPAAYWIE
jgi:hypothetical protein